VEKARKMGPTQKNYLKLLLMSVKQLLKVHSYLVCFYWIYNIRIKKGHEKETVTFDTKTCAVTPYLHLQCAIRKTLLVKSSILMPSIDIDLHETFLVLF
jgi:hypothetical protein